MNVEFDDDLKSLVSIVRPEMDEFDANSIDHKLLSMDAYKKSVTLIIRNGEKKEIHFLLPKGSKADLYVREIINIEKTK